MLLIADSEITRLHSPHIEQSETDNVLLIGILRPRNIFVEGWKLIKGRDSE
jgi:hypothetical protein